MLWQIFVFSILIVGLILVFYAKQLYESLPPVKRFREAHKSLVQVKIKSTKAPVFLSALCSSELRAVATPNSLTNIDHDHLLKSVGDTIGIIHFRDHTIKHTVTELRIYSFLLVILAISAILLFIGDNTEKSDGPLALFSAYLKWSGSSPFKVIAAFELGSLVFFLMKFSIEILNLSALVSKE